MDSQPLINRFYYNITIKKDCEFTKQSLQNFLEALEFAQKTHLMFMYSVLKQFESIFYQFFLGPEIYIYRKINIRPLFPQVLYIFRGHTYNGPIYFV